MTHDEIVAQVVIGVSTGVGVAILLVVGRKLSKNITHLTERFDGVAEGTLGLLHYRVFYNCTYYLELECITTEELAELEVLYEKYKTLGGNGTCKTLMCKIRELEIVSREELKRRKRK